MRRVLLLSVAVLGACTPAQRPRPVAANVTPPPAWRTTLPGSAPIAAHWWEGFGDPELTRLVTAALANNPDIAVAVARVAEARAAERVARAARFPTLDAGVGLIEQRALNAFGTASTGTSLQPVFQSAYEVDLFGRIGSTIDAARLTGAAAAAAADTARLSVAAATASGYITLRGLDARIETVRATIASRGEALRIARSRAEVGYTSQLELRQAEAEYAAVTQTLPQLELLARRQENALALLTGTPPRPIARGRALAALVPPPIPAGLPSDLLRRRPDIAQAEATLAASDASLAAARAQFLPQLRLTGSTGEVLSSALPNPVGIWSIGASVLAPLFRGGQLRGNYDGATARRDQAAFGYQRSVLTAFREIEDALAGVDRLAAQRRALETQRTATAEALRHATNRYRAGYSPYLEQLDAQRALFSAELSLEQVRADQLNALVALYQAMGGGWGG
ncbi:MULTISPECIES: efflux transporter outer membrane subunit [unclassified Sphingomonas]|uniref:efflux transporter outer membrane subunit n=1 Tax=unclassified Sphingomonas TaxID=196159 RepID=UPI0006FE3767|nr:MULTISPECIES: efflux transporter outer membrane subunit [unclassified Sphingomonas]KQM59919.1 RND transporter [Sphingomonas sp. Leaf16]KQN11317.1 RND transporter [Sphingomonas sp. Leaf29]KQN18639.1 RND transporter [Sphingomonas sp. Leaf32]